MVKLHCHLLMKVNHAIVARFFTSQICLLTLFATMKFSRKFPNIHLSGGMQGAFNITSKIGLTILFILLRVLMTVLLFFLCNFNSTNN